MDHAPGGQRFPLLWAMMNAHDAGFRSREERPGSVRVYMCGAPW
jgi:hypothetical protein